MKLWQGLLLLLLVGCAPPPGINDRLPAEGNQPFIIDKGDEQGVLLIHGLSATPWEVTPIANYLAERNITVVVTLLAGHGTTMAELNSVTWPEWYASANDSLAILKHKTKRVYVAGVSAGADVAVLLAANNELDGLILMAPPIEFQDSRAKFARVYQYILPYASHVVTPEEQGHYYPYIPSHSVAELNDMISHVKTALPRVTEPTLILQSIHDKTIKPASSDFVFRNIGSQQKELRLYGNASHVLVQEDDAPDIIFYSVGQFLEQN